MDELDVRAALDRAIRAHGETYLSMSRVLGRNPTYVQQFIRRGVPRRLEEADRRALARHLGVPEAELGGAGAAGAVVPRPSDAISDFDYVLVPQLDPAEEGFGFAFQAGWIGALASNGVERLTLVRVSGDAMLPTLVPGDHLIVDTGDGRERLRDGLYALRIEGALLVKRLAVNPANRKVTIRSDNAAYPAWEGCDPALLQLVGRVVWAGRRFL